MRRYRRKTYAQVVEFPVEIIGRDGQVRRYSFEEAVRLYQRRIGSADVRYDDTEVVAAEKLHCSRRIKQLRCSFFAHYGWPAIEIVDAETGVPGLLGGEVAAFLRRCLASFNTDLETFSFSALDATEDAYRVFFLHPPVDEDDVVGEGHFLLYLFTFDHASTCPRRESFFDMVKILDSAYAGNVGSVESLVAFHHTGDFGLILTGTGTVHHDIHVAADSAAQPELWHPEPTVRDPVEQAMRFLSRGRFEEALECFVAGYTKQHFRRVAYLGAAVVADQLGEDVDAETATVMGGRYFPNDAALVYHRAVTMLRRGQFTDARRKLESIENWPRGAAARNFVLSLAELAEGKITEGRRRLRSIGVDSLELDPHLTRGLRWVRAQLWARDLVMGFSGIAAAGGTVAAVWNLNIWWLLLGLFGGLVGRAAYLSWHRQLILQLSGPPAYRMRLSSSAVLLADRGLDPVQ
jgi:hypothetical protein